MSHADSEIERQKIGRLLLSEKPVHIKDFVDLFFRIYEPERLIDVDRFISVIKEMNLHVLIADIQYDVEKSGLLTMLQRRIADLNVIDLEKELQTEEVEVPIPSVNQGEGENFLQSEAYFYLNRFAKTQGSDCDQKDLATLRLLVKGKGWDVTTDALKFFIDFERAEVDYPDFDQNDAFNYVVEYAGKYGANNDDERSGLMTLLKTQGWELSSGALKFFIEKGIAKQLSDFELASTAFPDFADNEAYVYVKQFAKRYGENYTVDDLSKLELLIRARGLKLTRGTVRYFIDKEIKCNRLENIRAKILLGDLQNTEDILHSYLNHFRTEDSEALDVLGEILQVRNFSFPSTADLKLALNDIEREIELRNFEQRLASENDLIRIEDLDYLDGYEFEDFLKNLFLKMGCQVEQTRLSGDQGADLVVVKFGEKTVIQAKRFQGNVGNSAVQEIMAAISLYKAHTGMVVTNSYYTSSAKELALANNIELVDRQGLEELINKYW
ncbi:MAG: restriction endonuclease [Pyrinomonadaceae bacterium]